ncbi:MAG: tetratricopeptide repeat protein [Gammaproteobacteria bacterium]|nr:tetratricopeptide repeat protein [Gammaproteobacteria bacterium]
MSRSVVCLPLLAVFCASGLIGCAATASSDSVGSGPARITDAAESDHHLLLAELALQDGAFGTAINEYILAARYSDNPERASQAMRIAYQHGFLRRALVAAYYWRELRPEEKAARLGVAQLHLQLGNRKKATREFIAIIESEEQERGQLFLELTGIFMGGDGPWLASAVMEELARPYPELAQAHYAVASLALNASRFQLALAEASLAVEQDSEWLGVATVLARAKIALGQIEQGLLYADNLVLDSRDDGVRLDYAYMLMSVGHNDDARVELMLLLEETGSASALRALGFLEMDGGRFEEAGARFSRLLSTGEYTYDAFFYLGLIAERMEDYQRAMRAYARVNMGISAIAAQARLAHLINRLGEGEKALQHLDQFGAQNPGFRVDMMVARAELLGEMGRYPEALDLYKEVLELRPADEGTGYAMAFMLESSGDLRSSIKQLRSFVRKRRTDPLALNALGYTLVANTDRLKEAGRYINKAVRLAPVNAAIIDSKGWLHFKTGEYKLALEYLREAYALDNDPEIAAHLGEVLWEMGEQTEAQKFWFQALAVNPDSDALTETMERFGQ